MANPIPDELPQAGGSYTRNPDTGALVPNNPPPQDAPPATGNSPVAGESAPSQE